MTEAAVQLPLDAPDGASGSPAPAEAPATDPATAAAETAPEPKPEKPTVEIRISLGSDEKDILQILSALKLQDGPLALKQPETPPAPKPQEASLAPKAQDTLAAPKTAETPKPEAPPASAAPVSSSLAAPLLGEPLTPVVASRRAPARASWLSPFGLIAALALGFLLHSQIGALRLSDLRQRADASTGALVDLIIGAESSGNAAARNQYSSALGLGQFVEATWLDLMRRHRPEIASSRNEKEILDLRKDPELSRFLTTRYVEENTSILARKGLPVTPGAIYLAHFAGPGGAVAILTAPENANAADVIANVDSRPGVTREKIVTGNPFMKNFTARDLRNWAELKMQGLTLVEGGDRSAAKRDL
ncbi:MAG: hypothetical protein ACR652_22555 [Methylocystis sp.]|uniref:hypothetical protein n=1 Tax=Methylocystis sp. TaxID=1911079 RepID=UPI003DA37E72